ncbi:MAG TPA: hypothetical protein VFU49_02935 [Ktedonobacteraceae bacterium]|nr:hypothetical protein [Ktedonobacteraceae bacterium]
MSYQYHAIVNIIVTYVRSSQLWNFQEQAVSLPALDTPGRFARQHRSL